MEVLFNCIIEDQHLAFFIHFFSDDLFDKFITFFMKMVLTNVKFGMVRLEYYFILQGD